MRGHFLNYLAVGRLLLFAGIAIVIIIAADWLIRHTQVKPRSRERTTAVETSDGLAQRLARCQAIGTAARSDQACIAAWHENHRRFFGDRQ